MPISGDAGAVEQQVALAAQVLDGVGAQRLQLVRDAVAGARHGLGHRSAVLAHPGSDEVLAEVDVGTVDPHQVALGDRGHDRRADVVDQDDARLDQMLRAEVRVPAGDRRGGVHDGEDARLGERDGCRPIHVDVVDDGDGLAAGPLGQRHRPPVDPRDA